MVNCDHNGMNMVSDNTQTEAVAFKPRLIDIKEPKVCQENIPPNQYNTITQSRLDPWIHAVEAKFWSYHLGASAEIQIHQTRLRFFESSTVQLSGVEPDMVKVCRVCHS